MNKKLFIFLILFLTLISPVLAQPPFQTSSTAERSILIEVPVIEYHEANTSFLFHLHPHNSTDGRLIPQSNMKLCLIHFYNPNDGDHVIETNMTKHSNGIDWEYNASEGNFSELGQFAGYMYCETNTTEDLRGGYFEFSMEVTPTGEPTNGLQLVSRIFLILFFMFCIFLIQWNQKRIDYDKWYNSIAEKYKTKNTFRWVLSAVGYNIFKNSYIFSYLVGLLGLLVLTELTIFFNITSVITILKIVLGLYTWGALAVVIVFFSQVQEWIMEWKDDIESLKWGELTSVK